METIPRLSTPLRASGTLSPKADTPQPTYGPATARIVGNRTGHSSPLSQDRLELNLRSNAVPPPA